MGQRPVFRAKKSPASSGALELGRWRVRGRAERAGDLPNHPRTKMEWAHQDSNLGQAGYEPAALTAELWARNELRIAD